LRVRSSGARWPKQGAEVLHLARAAEYEYDALWADTAVGFRSAWMDLTDKQYVAKARDIIKGADVMVENFRGRKIAELGLSAQTAAEIRPGIIYTSIRGFGWTGPWSQRGGFDMDANCRTPRLSQAVPVAARRTGGAEPEALTQRITSPRGCP